MAGKNEGLAMSVTLGQTEEMAAKQLCRLYILKINDVPI
jgi:hypothetical protein